MSALIIVGLTVLVVFAIRWVILTLMRAFYSLCEWYEDGRGSILTQLLLAPVLLVLSIFAFAFTLLAAVCGITLAKKAYKWFNH